MSGLRLTAKAVDEFRRIARYGKRRGDGSSETRFCRRLMRRFNGWAEIRMRAKRAMKSAPVIAGTASGAMCDAVLFQRQIEHASVPFVLLTHDVQ